MKVSRILAAATVAVLLSACSGDQPEREAARSERAGSRAGLLDHMGVDARHPERAAPVALVVTPVDVPLRARAGGRVMTVFQARPDTSCQLEVVLENGRRIDRLAPAIADSTGRVAWSWRTDANAAGHIATAYVVCSGGQRGQAAIRIS